MGLGCIKSSDQGRKGGDNFSCWNSKWAVNWVSHEFIARANFIHLPCGLWIGYEIFQQNPRSTKPHGRLLNSTFLKINSFDTQFPGQLTSHGKCHQILFPLDCGFQASQSYILSRNHHDYNKVLGRWQKSCWLCLFVCTLVQGGYQTQSSDNHHYFQYCIYTVRIFTLDSRMQGYLR